MDKLSSVYSALSQTLTDSNLHGVTTDVGEALLDTLFEPGLAKDIPILGTLYKLCKAGLNISDRLFLKKLMHFLAEIAGVPAAERAKMISRIESSAKYQLKVGEKLLYLLEKSEDHENAQIVGYLFSAFLSGELEYDYFLRACRSVQTIMPADLRRFVIDNKERFSIHDQGAGDLLGAGLCEFDELQIRVVDEWDHKQGNKYRVEGGEMSVYITAVGKKVREILRSRWSAEPHYK
jgi:hypothetical protein